MRTGPGRGPQSRWAMRSGVNSSSTRARPRRPSSRRRAGSAASESSASARAAGSSGSTINPVSPSTTSSATPPTRVATTATPAAIASRTASGKLSAREGWTSTSSSRRRARESGTNPWKRESTPASCACRSSSPPASHRPKISSCTGARVAAGRVDQHVDALPVLEVRRDARDKRPVLAPVNFVRRFDPERDHVKPRSGKAVAEHEVDHRL
jgi:hypothetical protein